MTKTQLKEVIKEAILELVQEGHISFGNSSGPPQKETQKFRTEGHQLAQMIRNNTNPQAIKQISQNPNASSFLNLLADTAENTLPKLKEAEEFGETAESRETVEGLFPAELKDKFNKLFSEK